MFTGLIVSLGTVLEKRSDTLSATLKIKTELAPKLTLGESIAVNGVCLTASLLGSEWFQADVMAETWNSTNLTFLQPGDLVNLEPALAFGDRLGGHLVSGHVDCIGRVTRMVKNRNSYDLKISVPPEMGKFIAQKGSIAVNGVSLTVQHVRPPEFIVSLIPYTARETNLNHLQAGDSVNIEVDLLARYVVNYLEQKSENGITAGFLEEYGFKR